MLITYFQFLNQIRHCVSKSIFLPKNALISKTKSFLLPAIDNSGNYLSAPLFCLGLPSHHTSLPVEGWFCELGSGTEEKAECFPMASFSPCFPPLLPPPTYTK